MQKRDISKEQLYEGVKSIIDAEPNHLHLCQSKLYTLFSIAFQYILYCSTKEPGHYIVRIEDSQLLEKLQRKSKDISTRKFMQKLALPRRLKYGNSTFHLDFFNISTWSNTNELPKEKIKAALVVKNAHKRPIGQDMNPDLEEDAQVNALLKSLPSDYYYSTLSQFVPKTIIIAFEEDYDSANEHRFDFIVDEPKDKLTSGVRVSGDIDLDKLTD